MADLRRSTEGGVAAKPQARSSLAMPTKPRFRNEMYFPEQDNAAESSTAYETPARPRAAGPSAVVGTGGDGGDQPTRSEVGALSEKRRARGRAEDDFTSASCMAVGGRGDDLVFFEVGLQEYFYRNQLLAATLRIIIALSTSVLAICLSHNIAVGTFGLARMLLHESVIELLGPFENHPVLVFTRWVALPTVGFVFFIILVISATAKRSAKLQRQEYISGRMNSLYLNHQFRMHYDSHTDTLNEVH